MHYFVAITKTSDFTLVISVSTLSRLLSRPWFATRIDAFVVSSENLIISQEYNGSFAISIYSHSTTQDLNRKDLLESNTDLDTRLSV
jgi:hypothetical protein